MGRRFGGSKQLSGVGPGGETLLEYSLFDARRAGFGHVTFVIRPDMQDEFRQFAESRLPPALAWTIALQRLDDLPPPHQVPSGRSKPWGTAHALLAARASVTGAFAVVNADDYYGPEAFRALASCLGGDTTEWALVGYRLRATLSSAGGVNRGVLEVSAGGRLLGIEEVLDVAATEDDAVMGLGEAGPRLLHDDALVSMNLWGFRPDIFPALAEGFERFLDHGDLLSDEYPLPVAVQDLLAVTGQQVSVLTPGSRWFGMTYAEDLPFVRAELQRLTDAGSYPSRLWA